jgi:hypothetical protein
MDETTFSTWTVKPSYLPHFKHSYTAEIYFFYINSLILLIQTPSAALGFPEPTFI